MTVVPPVQKGFEVQRSSRKQCYHGSFNGSYILLHQLHPREISHVKAPLQSRAGRDKLVQLQRYSCSGPTEILTRGLLASQHAAASIC